MEFKYRISKLLDGTKVKVSHDLHKQIEEWKHLGITIPSDMIDEIKMQDDEWINKMRQYYRHTVSFEQTLPNGGAFEKMIGDKCSNVEKKIDYKERIGEVKECLYKCTQTQRRRFIKCYIHGYSISEIAREEGKSKVAVKETIDIVLKMLTNREQK